MIKDAKPCPFCRSLDLTCEDEEIDGWAAKVACLNCEATGPLSAYKYEDRREAAEDAVREWNRRK